MAGMGWKQGEHRRGWAHPLCLLLAFGALALPACAAGAEEAARVQATLLPEACVRGTQIRLGDLGVLQGDEALAARARLVVVGQAPLPGRERDVELDYIRIRLRQSRIDPDQFEFLAPPRIRVRGAGRVISPEEQIRCAEAAVRRACEVRQGEEVVVEALTTPAALTTGEGAVTLAADLGEGAALTGSVIAVRLRVLVDGAPAGSGSVTLRVRRLVPVWVATRGLAQGVAVGEGDTRVEKRDVVGFDQPLSPEHPVVGLRTRRPVVAGGILTSATLDAMPEVRRGDPVTVTLRAGAICVRVSARALEDAAVGRSIRVVNAGSTREYHARVTGPGAAEASLGAQP